MTAYPAAPERLRLVGRASAIESMLGVAERAQMDGGTILVSGEAGLGKSSLLAEFATRLPDWTLLRIQADRFEPDLRYSAVETLMRVLSARLGEHLPAPRSDSDSIAVGRTLLAAIDRLERPVCLIIDDAQWVDDASARAIRFAARRLSNQPFLIVAAARRRSGGSLELFDDLATASVHHESIALEPLTVANTQDLANDLLGHGISRRTATRLTDATHGSPLLLTVLLEQMRESFAEALHPAGWDVPLAASERVASAVAVALEGSRQPVRDAAELVAVLRDPIPLPLLGSIAARLHLELDALRAVQLGLVHAGERDGVTWVEPAHLMIAETLSAGVPLARRVEIHRAAASVLSGRRALRHRVEAARRADGALVDELLIASRECADLGEADEAMNYARSAVHLAPAGPVYARCLREIGLLAMRTRQHERIFDLIPSIESLPRSLVRDAILVELRTLTGNLTGGFAAAASVLNDDTDSAESRALRAHVACDVPMIQMATRDFAPVIGQIEQARDLVALAPSDPSGIPDASLGWLAQPREELLRLLGWEMTAASHIGRTDLVAAAIREVDGIPASIDDSPALVDVLVGRARLFILGGDLERARSDLARAFALMRSFPTSWTASHGRTMYAHVLYLLGEWDHSVTVADNAVALALDETDLSGWPLALTASTLVRAGRGDAEAVAERLESAERIRPGIRGAYDSDLPFVARAELARALGDTEAQLASATAGRPVSAASSSLGWLTYQVDALASLGRPGDARAAFDECRAGERHWRPYYGALEWLEGRVLESEGAVDEAAEAYERAVASNESRHYPLPLAVALSDLARALETLGRPIEALAAIRRSIAIFTRLEASTYLERAMAREQTLEKAVEMAVDTERSGQPGTRSSGGTRVAVDAASTQAQARFADLTAREKQVAVALAAGMTNKEIAVRLYISVTTVNFHVRNILAKLGVSSRRELRTLPTPGRGSESAPQNRRPRPGDNNPVKS